MSSTTRKRLYETVIAAGSILVVWGVISEQELSVLKDSLPELIAVATAVLARRNVNDD